MNFNVESIKKAISTTAPAVATALGSPLCGLVVSQLCQLFLGKNEASEEELSQAIAQASPETLLKLKELEMQCLQITNSEFANARAREVEIAKETGKGDWVMAYLVVYITLMFSAIIFLNTYIPDPTEKMVLEYVGNVLFMIIGYYFGHKRGST